MHTQRCRTTKVGNTQPHRYMLLHQPKLYISCSEAAVCTKRCRITKARNAHLHRHIKLHQPTFTFSLARLLCALKDAELWRQERYSHTNIYYCNNLRNTFLPASPVCALKDGELPKYEIKPLTSISLDLIFCAPVETCKATNRNVSLVQAFCCPPINQEHRSIKFRL